MSEEEDDKAIRGGCTGGVEPDYGNYYYRQKQSDNGTMVPDPKMPQNIRKGMMVEFGSTWGFINLSQVDVHGTDMGIRTQLDGNKSYYALVVRKDTYDRWIDIIWGEDVFRLYAVKGLQVQEAKEPPPEPSRKPMGPVGVAELPQPPEDPQEVLRRQLRALAGAIRKEEPGQRENPLYELIRNRALGPDWVVKK